MGKKKNYSHHQYKKNYGNYSTNYKKNCSTVSHQERNNSNSEEKRFPVSSSVNIRKDKKHPIVSIVLFLTLITSLIYFGTTLWMGQNASGFFEVLIRNFILVIFSILFVAICITNPNRKKGVIVVGSFFLLLFNVYGSLTSLGLVTISSFGQVENFTGKSLTEVVSWAEKNHVTLTQDYEYSDMVPEYNIISQNIEEGEITKDIRELTVSVSEGPNPDKEIIVPNMVGWNSDRIISYVEDNYLSNVEVEFTVSDKAENTVIGQSDSGSMKRSDALKLTFSLGEEVDGSDVRMTDLVNMSEFEATFYLKQHRISYDIERDFSNKIERGHVSAQSSNAGDMVPVNNEDEKVTITISRGQSIKVPNLKKMSMVEITDWIIENKLKIEFSNRYDDSVKENQVIEANYSKGDIVEQGTTIEVVISRGSLVMEEFDNYEDFKQWADQYGISYEEQHEFSDDVPQGEVISYSYKKGETIKNGDSIIVTISDGSQCEVPDLIGMSRKEAIEALEDAGLNYNFVTQNSNKSKNTVIKQSISSGSKVSSGTTVTVTLSNGKNVEYREDNESSNNSNSSSSSSNSGSNSSNNNSGSSSTPPANNDQEEEVVCNSCTITGLRNIYNNYMGSFENTANALRNHITSQCPGITVIIQGDSTSTMTPGSPVGGFNGGNTTSCSTETIIIAQ